jgi:hypothetical protein
MDCENTYIIILLNRDKRKYSSISPLLHFFTAKDKQMNYCTIGKFSVNIGFSTYFAFNQRDPTCQHDVRRRAPRDRLPRSPPPGDQGVNPRSPPPPNSSSPPLFLATPGGCRQSPGR